MPRIYPALNCNRSQGFSLLEVLVAVAVVAMTVAAAASSILVSRRIETAAEFYRDALYTAESVQAEAYGLVPPPDETDGGKQLAVEEEIITSDPENLIQSWMIYTIRSGQGERRVSFAVQAVPVQ